MFLLGKCVFFPVIRSKEEFSVRKAERLGNFAKKKMHLVRFVFSVGVSILIFTKFVCIQKTSVFCAEKFRL